MANAVFDVSKESKRVIALIKTGDYYAQNQDFDNAIRSYYRACSCFPVEYLTDKPDGLETLDEVVQDDVKELHSIIYSRLAGCLSRRKPVWEICLEQLFGIQSSGVCGFNSVSDIWTSLPFPINGPQPGINSHLSHVGNSTDDAAGSLTSQNEAGDPNGLIPEIIVSKISSNEEPHLALPKNQAFSEIQAEMDVYGESDPPDGALC